MEKVFIVINEQVYDTDHLFIGVVKDTKGVITEINPENGEEKLREVPGYGFEINDSREYINKMSYSLAYPTWEDAIKIRDGLIKEINDILSGKIGYTDKDGNLRKLYV